MVKTYSKESLVSCDETSMTAQPKSRPFLTPPWYGPFYATCFCCLGPQFSWRHQPTRERVDDMLKVLHWESLGTSRKNNRLSLLLRINIGHVDITIDQCLQRSNPRTRGAQRFRHARAEHPALYLSFSPATLRQWNRLPSCLLATTCPEAFNAGLRALTSALIYS